jgi:hypothetical protein
LRGRWKRGAERNALGRSRGGFSTKINARANAEGLPIGIVITPGQAHDVTAFPALMQEIDCDPEQMLGDKGTTAKPSAMRLSNAVVKPQSPAPQPGKYSMPSIRLSMHSAIGSSASSIV